MDCLASRLYMNWDILSLSDSLMVFAALSHSVSVGFQVEVFSASRIMAGETRREFSSLDEILGRCYNNYEGVF